MRINVMSVMVDDQAKALRFYTEVLGFVKAKDVPMGDARWLTVVAPEGSPEIELVLEPSGFPPARVFQRALVDAGIPFTSFESKNVREEHARLAKKGVVFKTPPTEMGPVTVATFEDTCGNLIQIHQAT